MPISPMDLPKRMWAHGQKWAEYNAIIPAGVPLSAVMSRDYWIHVHNYLSPFDIINCVSEDGSFDVAIRLLSKTTTEMKFRLIRGVEAESGDLISRTEVRDRFVVKSGGRAGGWRVQEKSTGQIVADGLDKESAESERARLEMAA